MSLFSEKDCRRIEEAVAEIERESATELVVADLSRGASYFRPRAAIASALTVGLALAINGFWPYFPIQWVLLAQIPLSWVLFVMLGRPLLLRHIVTDGHFETATRDTAYKLFAAHGIYRTRARTGVLIALYELEHRVVILADEGITRHVGGGGWQAHVDHIIARIKEGRAADGVIETIAACRELLAQHVPVEQDDTNELPDRVVRR